MIETDWNEVLAAAARLQELLPDAVLVGDTAASIHAAHRISFDDDHVLTDLRERYDEVLAHLEETDGWATNRVNRPVLILGSLDGIETGVRQLIRRRPLEVEEIDTPAGLLRVPTLAEIVRVEAWLVLRRNATRDYLDLVALSAELGQDAAAAVALGLDEYYEDQLGSGGRRVATQLAKQLADPAPYDFSEVDLGTYRKLDARWRDWDAVVMSARGIAHQMLNLLAEKEP